MWREPPMRAVRFKCRNCGQEGKAEVLTKEEKTDQRIPKRPVLCPRCGSDDLEVG